MDTSAAHDTFVLPLAMDYAATFFVGISGALAGVRRGFDIVGIFFLAMVSGIGGAFLRDSIFLHPEGPLIVITDPNYLWLVIAATVIGVFFRNNLHHFGRIISVMDAIGLSTYAILGATKSLAAGVPETGAVVVAIANAVGGGVIRDVCSGEKPMIFRPGEFYALVACLGATLYVLLVRFEVFFMTTSAYLCIAVMLVVRLMTIAFNWKTKSFATLYEGKENTANGGLQGCVESPPKKSAETKNSKMSGN